MGRGSSVATGYKRSGVMRLDLDFQLHLRCLVDKEIVV